MLVGQHALKKREKRKNEFKIVLNFVLFLMEMLYFLLEIHLPQHCSELWFHRNDIILLSGKLPNPISESGLCALNTRKLTDKIAGNNMFFKCFGTFIKNFYIKKNQCFVLKNPKFRVVFEFFFPSETITKCLVFRVKWDDRVVHTSKSDFRLSRVRDGYIKNPKTSFLNVSAKSKKHFFSFFFKKYLEMCESVSAQVYKPRKTSAKHFHGS